MGFIMISRALLLALSCACATALASLTAAGDDSDCALYLTGPGRSSAYDYSLNLLKGNFGYEGQHTCITYEAINQAYHEARNRIAVSQPKGDWKPEDFASVGELILDISINLARTYGLTYEEIEKGLPLIDTSRTLIREVCPPVFSHVECRAGKYRRLDGLCNNLQHPTWGAINAPFQRLIGPLFADGINAPRISHTGRELPLSRVVSRTMHPDEGFHDHAGTVMVIAWGQFMDHDYTLTGTPLDPINRNDPEECCKRPLHLKHPYCNEIRVPDDDYFYRLFGVKCIDFVRGFPSPRPGCRLGSRVPFNTLTGAIDGNTVYGVTEKFARKLRMGYGGLLRMNPVFKEYGLKDLLPLKLDIPDEGCTRPNKNMYCFEAGEIRVNEQLVLTVMHTLMAREHNRVAQGLSAVNPHWDDETIFQEARRINIAEIQHITYNEFLPILLGKDVMDKFGLVLEKEGYWDGYDDTVNPDVIASFASAAYRFGHSLLPTAIERWSKAHKFIASKRLSDLIRRPYDLYRAGVLDEYVMGLMNQVAQAMDDSITQEVTNHLFKKIGARFGMDLVSFNMQRGREFGIPGYMEFRKFCGLSGADSFQDLFGTMSNETVRRYESIFEHPIDVDLWSGGVSERPLPGSMLGPTFACIIATQFSYSRRGDRFWFELPNQPSSFTSEQLVEIRKSRLARVICDNTDIIDTVQLYPMVLPDHELNPRVPCRSGIIPSMDFSKWAEPAPFHGPAKQFMTDAHIPPKNYTAYEEQTENIKENGNGISGNITTTVNPGNAFIQTAKSNLTQRDLEVPVVVNNISNETQSTVQNCTNNTRVANCSETQFRDSDTVLKYVYKKDDKLNVLQQKNKGHAKNSLKRRKRSISEYSKAESVAASSPVTFHYKTLHPPKETKHISQRSTANVIQRTDLADFKHETLHDNLERRKQIAEIENKYNTEDDNQSKTRPPSSAESDEIEDDSSTDGKIDRDSEESSEKSSYRDQKTVHEGRVLESDESDENNYSKNEKVLSKPSAGGSNSRESEESSYRKPINSRESHESDENEDDDIIDDRTARRHIGDDSEAINEKDYNRANTKSAYKNSGDNSRENDDYRNNRKPDYQKEYIQDSNSREKTNNGKKNYNRANNKPVYRNHDDDSKETDYYKNEQKPVSREDHTEDRESKEKVNNINSEENIHNRNNDKTYVNSDDANTGRDTGNYKNGKQSYYDKENEESEQPSQNSNESEEEEEIIAIMTKKNRKPLEYGRDANINDDDKSSNASSPFKIKDVDIGDFNYERIHFNDKGVVEPSQDSHSNYNIGHLPEITPLATPKPNLNFKNEKYSIDTTDNNQVRDEINEDIRKQTHINDGEVKPVVEINRYSGESNEKGIKADFKENDEDLSLETLLGVKETDSDDLNEKIVAPQGEDQKEDVKQQFERIPLNYKHNDTDKKHTENANEPNLPQTPSESHRNAESYNPGTLDVLIPEDHSYDENLNIKFDDLTIKLPEIKLPKDILAYDVEDSPAPSKDKGKPKFFQYSDEYSDEKPHGEKKRQQKGEKDDHDVEFDHGYRGYYGDYKKDQYKAKDGKNDDHEEEKDENEDLYEKFVRERFGKSSYEKRSEKLRDVRPIEQNSDLYNTLKQVLKKTEIINKEAEKSGDPNAGYAWTLEYGQKL